jgi:hypothetical protein
MPPGPTRQPAAQGLQTAGPEAGVGPAAGPALSPASGPGNAARLEQAGLQGGGELVQAVPVASLLAALALDPAPEVAAVEGALDLAPLLTWLSGAHTALGHATDGLRLLAPTDPERARLRQAIDGATARLAQELPPRCAALQGALEALMRASSPLNEAEGEDGRFTPPAAPTLPAVGQIDRLRTLAHGLRLTLGGDDDLEASRASVAVAAPPLADAALALYQAQAVLGARRDWAVGYRQPQLGGGAAATADAATRQMRRQPGARDGLNAVFADSGWNTYGVDAVGSEGSGWEPNDWCGMFVARHLFRSGGLDGELRAGFFHTDNVLDFFRYRQEHNASRVPLSTWSAERGRWVGLRAYHTQRGSSRTWTPRAALQADIEGGGAPFRSGDVCLINHSGGNEAQHIVMVDHYDPESGELVTIEGNTLGIRANARGKVQRNRADGATQDSGATSVGLHVREMRDTARDREAGGGYQHRAGATVLGCGRLSAVDFENRDYASLPISAFPEAMLTRAPGDMTGPQRRQVRAATQRDRGVGR